MRAKLTNRALKCILSCALALAINPGGLQARPYQPPAAQDQSPAPDQPQSARLTPEQLQELVAPIALYPDALLAQVLAASAYPTQIVEAQRFLQQNPNLKGTALGSEVDKQDWDPSVKALTQFPSVIADMDKNLSWTSELGDANYNQQADVMDAVQVLRKKAEQAGNLKSTPQQTVTSQGPTVVIQPADPQVVYVPDYDPELIYGYPMGLWPGFYPWWGPDPYLSFGVGYGISPFVGFGWGWGGWGLDWGHRGLLYGGGRYAFRSHSFYDRNAYIHGNYRGFAAPYARGDRVGRGFSPAGRPGGGLAARPQTRSGGAFGGVSRGGDTRGYSSRGQSSMGAPRGGGFGGARGGGGFGGARGGGGGHGGGGRR